MSTEEEDRNIAPPKQTPPAVLFLKVLDTIDMHGAVLGEVQSAAALDLAGANDIGLVVDEQ